VSSPSEALQCFSAVIVTGGSSGIGKSFIELLQKLRPELPVCNLSRSEPPIIKTGKRLNDLRCDLSRPGDVDNAAAAVADWLDREAPAGSVLLINNSGFGTYGRFPEPNLDHILEMLDVNIRGLVQLTGRLLPVLRARGGAIVNLGSTAAFQPTAYLAAYGASKAFVLHWSLALGEELRGSGVRTLAVCPGPTATQFFRRAGLKEGSVADALSMSADAVVIAALRALGAGRRVVVPGWKNKLSVAVASKLPKPLAARIGAWVLARYRLKQVRR
jgi:short-subunit dehydrogenase